ncbi:unnamed protein product [Blepharisma stoltei]|uniref:Uncharacterized protein n=1 Tax=Blepharisma stoltei TaxID=1481888 RepID=A0AAU9JPC3_9CILI|nr:unnamed protein product [Blepharisma stoltei]
MFLVSTRLRTPSLSRILLSFDKRDTLSAALTSKDPKFEPDKNLPKAQKAYSRSRIWRSIKSIFIRKYNWMSYLTGFMIVSTILMSFNLKNKKSKDQIFQETDESKLTRSQKKVKQELEKEYQNFNTLLDAAEEQLKKEHQKQLVDLQEYVEAKAKKPTSI